MKKFTLNNSNISELVSMQTSKGSTFSRAKNHVVYVRYGEHVGSQANKAMQSMLAAAAITTPSVAACGATTVWGNGPTAPPTSAPSVNGLRGDALNGTIGYLDMATTHIGSLVDNIIKYQGENYVEQTTLERTKTSEGNETVRISR